MARTRILVPLAFSVLQLGCALAQAATQRPDSKQDAAPAAGKAATQACMIAGQLKIAGQVIRSRDCTQTSRSIPRAAFEEYCNSLAQFSAQLGGQAGKITYLDQCPSPNQGSCKNFARSGMDGFYYERTADDLATLPESCTSAGGTWVK